MTADIVYKSVMQYGAGRSSFGPQKELPVANTQRCLRKFFFVHEAIDKLYLFERMLAIQETPVHVCRDEIKFSGETDDQVLANFFQDIKNNEQKQVKEEPVERQRFILVALGIAHAYLYRFIMAVNGKYLRGNTQLFKNTFAFNSLYKAPLLSLNNTTRADMDAKMVNRPVQWDSKQNSFQQKYLDSLVPDCILLFTRISDIMDRFRLRFTPQYTNQTNVDPQTLLPYLDTFRRQIFWLFPTEREQMNGSKTNRAPLFPQMTDSFRFGGWINVWRKNAYLFRK